MKRKKIIWYVVLPAVLVLGMAALYIYKEYNRTHKDTARLKVDYTVTATGLIKEFETNEKSSNTKYWDKVLRVEGMIKDLSRDEKGFYSIVLGDSTSRSSVRCGVDSNHNHEVAGLRPGSPVAVKGICSGFNADELLGSDVILVRSVVDKKNDR